MDKIELEAAPRDVLGKKVKHLRSQGVTPVHLFGHGIKSQALQCDTDKLQQALATSRKTSLISLKIAGEKRARNIIITEVQREAANYSLLHVDFHQVKKAEQIKVEVPIVLVGESEALKLKVNTLMQELDTLTIECPAGKVPASVEVDISSLTETEHLLRVKDIKLDKNITILNNPALAVASIITMHPVEIAAEVKTGEIPEAATSGKEEPEES